MANLDLIDNVQELKESLKYLQECFLFAEVSNNGEGRRGDDSES
jgi:hypothetical protein